MILRSAVCFGVLVSATVATGTATVYKCEEKGTITYTDQPCAPDAAEAPMPELIVTVPPTKSQRELAHAWDERVAREQSERDRGNAEWLKQHRNKRDREARVRQAIIEHRVIKSMTAAEVEQALGEPDHIDTGDSYGSAKQTWTYRDDGGTRKVNFKNGEVISTTRKGKREK